MKASCLNFLFLFVVLQASFAQKVVVSEEVNLRGDFAYEIMKPIGDNIFLYRDRGVTHEIIAYDKDLQFKWERDIKLDKRKVSVIDLVDTDRYFNMFYSYREEGKNILKVDQFDSRVDIQDSIVLHEEEGYKSGGFKLNVSENDGKTLIYRVPSKDKLFVTVVDNDSLVVEWQAEIEFSEINLFKDKPELIVTNNGEIYMALDKYNTKYKKEKHVIQVMKIQDGPIESVVIPMKNKVNQGLLFTYDNINGNINLTGLYGEGKSHIANGYFRLSKPFQKMNGHEEPIFTKFSDEFLTKVYTNDSKKKKGLENFKAVEVLHRYDGGMLLITEMQKKFSRRNPISNVSSNQYSVRGWHDYFNEDVLLIAIHPDGKEHWKEILYKKQFSQDDNIIYSSFFTFSTPSRLKVIFNDQIKLDNTVSEYVIDGLGNSKRESLFSTEHQGLKLRISDAIQISPTELLIPSERNSHLNIVKISYM